ncbi:MAG: hypothetical protein V1716_05110 [Candidatus Uhrbacteria bacterium]
MDDDGYNSESGADWSGVSEDRRALLVDAAIAGETVARGDSVEIAEILTQKDLKGKWGILETRADTERIKEIKKCLRVPLSAIETPDNQDGRAILVAVFGSLGSLRPVVQPPPVQPPLVFSGSRTSQLTTLLENLFNIDELKRFLQYTGIVNQLNFASGIANVAFEAVLALERTGLINATLFLKMNEERPGRAREIQQVRGLFGV